MQLEHSLHPEIVDKDWAVATGERKTVVGPPGHYSERMGSAVAVAVAAAAFAARYYCHKMQRLGSQESVQHSAIRAVAEYTDLSGRPHRHLTLAESAAVG